MGGLLPRGDRSQGIAALHATMAQASAWIGLLHVKHVPVAPWVGWDTDGLGDTTTARWEPRRVVRWGPRRVARGPRHSRLLRTTQS